MRAATLVSLLAIIVTGCAAAAATPATTSWHVDSRIVIAVLGAFSFIFWRYLDHREKAMQESLRQYTTSVNARLDNIDRQLQVVTRVEVELSGLPLLARKLDDTTTKLVAHELDVAKNYASMASVQSMMNAAVYPLKESLAAIHRRLDTAKGDTQ